MGSRQGAGSRLVCVYDALSVFCEARRPVALVAVALNLPRRSVRAGVRSENGEAHGGSFVTLFIIVLLLPYFVLLRFHCAKG